MRERWGAGWGSGGVWLRTPGSSPFPELGTWPESMPEGPSWPPENGLWPRSTELSGRLTEPLSGRMTSGSTCGSAIGQGPSSEPCPEVQRPPTFPAAPAHPGQIPSPGAAQGQAGVLGSATAALSGLLAQPRWGVPVWHSHTCPSQPKDPPMPPLLAQRSLGLRSPGVGRCPPSLVGGIPDFSIRLAPLRHHMAAKVQASAVPKAGAQFCTQTY